MSLDFEAKFLDLPSESFQQSCQNCFLRVQWTTFRTIIVFSENFESFWTLSDNCPDLWPKFSAALPNVHSTCPKDILFILWMVLMFYLTSDSSEKHIRFEKKFRHFCWNCILSVRELFEEFLSRTCLFLNLNWIMRQKYSKFGKIFQQNRQKCSLRVQRNTLTKTMLAFWNKFRFWARKDRICGGKIEALLSNLHYCLQMGTWKKNFEGNFTFSDFFWTSREHFLVFSLYHSRHGDPNWIPPAKRNISIRKNFRENFLSFPDYERNFLNLHWSLLGMLSKWVHLFIGALWERLFFPNFSNLFSDFER